RGVGAAADAVRLDIDLVAGAAGRRVDPVDPRREEAAFLDALLVDHLLVGYRADDAGVEHLVQQRGGELPAADAEDVGRVGDVARIRGVAAGDRAAELESGAGGLVD